jgi:hypothetical protein
MDKNTGLMHDDDGHVDDKRVVGWILVAFAVGMGLFGVWRDSANAVAMAQTFLWPGITALGITVVEKMRRQGGG